MALQMSCSECGLLLCQECIEYLNGKPVCSCCLQELQTPRIWPQC
jgi:formylmethanofuran dehydrogenase subunit E